MAMSSCPDCGHGVSASAAKCPACGNKLKRGCFESCAIGVLIGGVMLGAALALITYLMRDLPNIETDPKLISAFTNDMMESEWVKDVHVAAGHANIGVFREEKDWSSASIARFTCATAKMHGLHRQVTWVRFVDSRQIAAGKTPRQAEIVKLRCDYAALP